MKLNYIILAHQYPLQLRRLVNKLHTIDSKFYIHIDKNVEIQPFIKALKNHENVFFLGEEMRENGIWGDIGIVRATIKAMEMVVSENNDGFCVLLTGQDYPLKSTDAISGFLSKHHNTNFIDLFSVQNHWRDSGLDRIYKYKINKSNRRGHFLFLPSIYDRDFYKRSTLGKLNFLRKSNRLNESKVIFKRRKFPKGLDPFGGSVYWALPLKTLRRILVYLENHPNYLEYHKHTLCADEIFFNSIVARLAKDSPIKIGPSLTYVNWKRTSGPRPVTFEINDFEELKIASSDFLFARKFNLELDKEILDKCDKELLK